jgi:hypothetical protein
MKAKHHYTRFVELWQACDPELKPAVLEVKARLRQLQETPGGSSG